MGGCAGAQTTTASLLFATGIKTVPDPLKASTFTWKGMVNVGQRHGEWKRVADGPVEVVNRDVFGESHTGKRECNLVEKSNGSRVVNITLGDGSDGHSC